MKGKILISFIAGSAFGGAVAWFVTKRKYEKINEEDAESFRNGFKKCHEEIKSLKEELKHFKKEDDAQNDQDPAEIKKRGDEIVESVLESVKAIQEQHKYKNYSDSADGITHDENGNRVNNSDLKKRIDIEKITEAIFNEPNSKFEKCGITLYMDAVFTDDADKEMSDGYLSETIGIDIRDELVASSDVGTVYVRNHKTGKDYEILCLDESWSDVHEVD